MVESAGLRTHALLDHARRHRLVIAVLVAFALMVIALYLDARRSSTVMYLLRHQGVPGPP